MSSRWGGSPQCPRCQKAVYMAEQVTNLQIYFKLEYLILFILFNFIIVYRLLVQMVHGIKCVLLAL